MNQNTETTSFAIENLTWTDAFLVGFDAIDDTHREFVEIVGAMLRGPDTELAQHLGELIEHSERHFSQEEELMRRTAFPATECHSNEHAGVLRSMREVLAYLENGGEVNEARRLAVELARWFPGHTDYLDASLGQWAAKKQLGAVPVVVKRGMAQHDTD